MKKIILLCLMAISFCAQAQFVTIPDANFRNALIQFFPSCFNGSQQMDITHSYIVNEFTLDVHFKSIANLDGLQYFTGLKNLDCANNLLTSLPNLPNLTGINCSYNQLTNLPTLPYTLVGLTCNNNQLTSLPPLPASLKYLYCNNNQLINLPTLPNLINLECNNNQLTSLPPLSTNLEFLVCYSNKLTSIPTLYSSLKSLACYNNKLTSLPSLPSSLIQLTCQMNQLTSLPNLPTGLNLLWCGSNQLTSLATIPNSLTNLSCLSNLLTSLPSLPNNLTTLVCNNNPFLSCLPNLPNGLTTLVDSNTAITCLPNKPAGIANNPLPLCGIGSSCETYPTASGLIFHDLNSNGTYDLGIDSTLKGWIISNTNGFSGNSNINGEYIVKLDSGVVNTLTLAQLNQYSTITPISIQIIPTSSGSQGSNYNFAILFIPNIQDLRVDIATGPARPGFDQWCTTTINNVGTMNVNNETLKVIKPVTFTFLNSNPAISQQVGDTLIWNNINIGVLQHKGFDINWNIPASSVLGAPYQIQAWINPITTDTTPANNYFAWNGIFQGSYDPNDKSVNLINIDPSQLDQELKYTIRFQNTGTDTAFTVMIRDTLSNNLDMSTFRILGASHNYSFIVRDHSLLEVFFQNILLPDSFTNEPKSHGFVQYAIKPKSTLTVGEEINNTAYIYFDFNAPVITNTTNTRIVTTSISDGISIDADINPNPNNGKVKISLTPSPISATQGEGRALLTIQDLNGRELLKIEVKDDQEVDLSGLSAGMYLAKIETKLGSKRMKIIVNE